MWEKRVDVIEEMPVPVGDAARRKDEDSLFGFFGSGGSAGGGIRMTLGFRKRFVDSCHCAGFVEILWFKGCN